MTRYLTETHRHTQQKTGKNPNLFKRHRFFFTEEQAGKKRQRSERGLTIPFGLLIISHLPQCRSDGIRGDARTLHIFGLSARTCEYEPKIEEEREKGREMS